MTFVSFAQNFEDVMLWRALRHVGQGFYIDVGASHPDIDSVTRAFYDRGWHGINVEPAEDAFLRLQAARPRDTNLHLALADVSGEASFFVVPGTGLSTLDPEFVSYGEFLGGGVQEVSVAVETLAAICRRHMPDAIHFLKIDVEGAERKVLAGADFSRFRPWIVLVEATAPMSQTETHAAWEPMLLQADYRFVWFDGLNRFYLAAERYDALAEHFRTPPNVFDDFLRAADTEWARRVHEATTRAATAEARSALTESELQALRLRTDDLQLLANSRSHEVGQLREALGATEGRLAESLWRLDLARDEMQARLDEARARHAEVVWRLGVAHEEATTRLDAIGGRLEASNAHQAEAIRHLGSAHDEARARHAEAERRAADAELRAAEAIVLVEAMRASTSWKVTWPLRRIGHAVRGRSGNGSSAPTTVPAPATDPALIAAEAPQPAPPDPAISPTSPPSTLPSNVAVGASDPADKGTPTAVADVAVAEPPHASAAIRAPVPGPVPETPPEMPHAEPWGAPPFDASGTRIDVAASVPRATMPSPALRAVHQFHSGSAVGDAITQSMLLVRGRLRALGYTSDIFVAHRDPALAGELRLTEELPRHAGYVLIVHHSMGFDAFARVAALPAPKVLFYHNITPPALLARIPILQQYAELGRAQLRAFRDVTVGALADSEYNAMELRDLGFDPVQSCMLLFDIDVLRARGMRRPVSAEGRPFTILFVGRVTESKGQSDLVAAYARFRSAFGRPARLVLPGRQDDAGSAYMQELRGRIRDSGHAAEILLPGLISDDELHAWYCTADLFVSLSRHEGFGVPLVEAMAHGVPVLAWPSGAVPHTLGGTAELLPARDPETVALAMLRLARDPASRRAIARCQTVSLDRFRLERQMPILVAAIARAGAASPVTPTARAELASGMRFAVAGHVAKTYSLASVNRAVAAALEEALPGRVRMIPVEGGPTSDLSEVPPEALGSVAALAARTRIESGPEVLISQHYPVFVPDAADRASGDVRLALVFWEESLVPTHTVATLNEGFDGVLAPTTFVAKTLLDSGVTRPVRVVGHAPDLSAFARLGERRQRRAADRFTFLHVSSCFPRKGVNTLLEAFARAFRRSDPVRLVIKGFPNPHSTVAADVEALRQRDADAPEIVLIDRDLAQDTLLDLYRHADAMVLPTRGEGFNIPAAEAMAAGIPVIVTGHGGHMDFLGPDTARLLRYSPERSGSHLATPHSLWVKPDAEDLVAALREAVADQGEAAQRAERARGVAAALGDRMRMVERLVEAGLSILLAPPAPPLRVAWVSSWKLRCGVAEYSRHLLGALPEAMQGTIMTVLCDDRTAAPETNGDGVAYRTSWRLGDPNAAEILAAAVSAEDPGVVVVQHQPALIPWATLASFLTAPASRRWPIVVVLHNSRHLLDLAPTDRHPVLDALAGIARVVVHTLADITLLTELGLAGNLTLLPHGVVPPPLARPPRTLPPDTSPLIGSYGFFLPGKGIGPLIQAIAQLRLEWPRIRLRLVNAEYGDPTSAEEIAACRRLAVENGVADAVEWVTDFLPHERSLALLAECDLVVLPYQASKEASSAALRTAVTSGAPVAVTSIALFEEAEDAVIRLAGVSADVIAAGISLALRREDLRQGAQRAASSWAAERDWAAVAQRFHGMLRGLAATAGNAGIEVSVNGGDTDPPCAQLGTTYASASHDDLIALG